MVMKLLDLEASQCTITDIKSMSVKVGLAWTELSRKNYHQQGTDTIPIMKFCYYEANGSLAIFRLKRDSNPGSETDHKKNAHYQIPKTHNGNISCPWMVIGYMPRVGSVSE